MKEKIQLKSNKFISVDEDSTELLEIVQKRDIQVPSVHLGFFKTIYAKIEEPNLNGIRLAKNAVIEALPGLIGSQVNFEHLGAGFIMGNILDAWINDDAEIEVVYSMFKSIYPDEYEKSVEQVKDGTLSVSFELLSEKDSQEILPDGSIRLNDIDFVGMGHLMDNPPAYPGAKVKEFAQKCKERLSNIENRELVCASVIEKACDEIINADKWSSDIWNNFPDSSFAVIEPAFLNGRSGDFKARHLAFKDRTDRVDLTNWRIAQDKVNEILPVTDSITTEELRKQAKEELDKYTEESIIVGQKTQGGVKSMTQEDKEKIETLRAELGDFAKDVKDEDLLDDAIVAEIRKTKADKEKSDSDAKKEEIAFKIDSVEVRTFSLEEKDGVETVVEEIKIVTVTDWNAMLEAKDRVAELEASLEAKDSEIEAVRTNAEKIGKTKVQLKDNDFAKDFTDEDYLDDDKIAKAIQDQKDSETVAERKEELKDNEYAKDFTDEDYLNDDKVELANVKKEKDELAKTKDKKTAKKDDKEEDLEIGDKDENTETPYEKVCASMRDQKTKTYSSQTVYEKKINSI